MWAPTFPRNILIQFLTLKWKLCVCVCVCVCVHIFYADVPDKTVPYPEGYNNNLIIIYGNCIVEQSVKIHSVTILSS